MHPSSQPSTALGGDDVVLERVGYVPAEWERVIATYPRAEVYHSPQWLTFLSATQGAEPVVAQVHAGGIPVGHFVGAVVRRYGIRILGSPMPGWTTQHMGFLLHRTVEPRTLAEALRHFAFGELGCLHIEFSQRGLLAEQLTGSGYTAVPGATYLADLDVPEQTLVARMAPRTRTYVRRALRDGISVQATTDPGFADEYHAQLTQVFARQGLVPTYGVERVRQLIRIVGPSDQVLLLRVCGPDGACLATGISVGRNDLAVNWGTAHEPARAALHPNELLWWETMRRWRERGASRYDFGGRGDYKAKFGGVLTDTVHFHRSRPVLLARGRTVAERLVKTRQALAGRRTGPGSGSGSG